MSNEITIETLFQNLDKWRNFAGFPLEERVDPLIGLFLPKIIEDHCEIEKINTLVIPQFPFKKYSKESNRSYKADYLAVSEDSKKIYLIEIKTDITSKNKCQDKRLLSATKRPLYCIMSDLKNMAIASKGLNRRKYLHLLDALHQIDLIKMPSKLKNKIEKNETKNIRSTLICKVKIPVCSNLKPEVIYIQPRKHGKKYPNFKYIYFEDIANYLKDQSGLGRLLAEYLRIWKNDPGESIPSEL